MGTIAEKLQYTKDAVDSIQSALTQIGVDIDSTDPLGAYADKILNGASRWKVYDSGIFAVTDVTHSAVKEDSGYVDNSTWVALSNADNPFTLLHEHGLGLDIAKLAENNIHVIGQITTENAHGFRRGAGYASGTTTAQYSYFEMIPFGQYNTCGPKYSPGVAPTAAGDLIAGPIGGAGSSGNPVSFDFISRSHSNNYSPATTKYVPLETKVSVMDDFLEVTLSGRSVFATRGTLDQIKVRYWMIYKA